MTELLVGFEAIAEALRTSPRQVLVWATRKREPLPLMAYLDVPRIEQARLEEWRQRHLDPTSSRKVYGWNTIARTVEMSRISAIRAAEWDENPLPVKPARGINGRVWAYAEALREWKEAHVLPYPAHRKLRALRRAARASEPLPEPRAPEPRAIREGS